VIASARPALDEGMLKAMATALGGDAGQESRRVAALARYETAAEPDRVRHLWRFTNPALLLPLSLAGTPAAGAVPASAAPVAGASATIDLWPGRAPAVQTADDLPVGALVFTAADEPFPGGKALPSDLFGALGDAAWNTGVGLKVADGVKLVGPIHVRVHASAAASLPRLRLEVGRNAEAMLVEQHIGGGPDVRVVGRTVISAGEGAHVRHAVVQVWESGTCGHLAVETQVGADADILTVCGVFGGEDTKLELRTDLAGAGAHSEIIGVALLAGKQHADVHTSHRHLSDHTSSRIDYKTVAGQQARSTYSGLIRIEDRATHCEAYQENRNLLLSSRARADAIPELEIHNQEVSCSHGATIAPVDPEQLFYLGSRGLDAHEAMGLVVRGFLENTLAKLPDDARAMVETFTAPRLATIREGTA
jgi:Fe-S cluster assembly protein SufD